MRRPIPTLLGLVLIVVACGDAPRPSAPVPAVPPEAVVNPSPERSTPAADPPAPSVAPPVAPPLLERDPYDVPDPLPPGRPGDPIRLERVAAPRGAVAWRLLYLSKTIHGEAIGVTGLVVAPDRAPPAGGFPVLAYAHGTAGLADVCAPSRVARGVGPSDVVVAGLPIPPFWEDGFVVAATDYEGLGTPGRHPYLVGGSEARSVLDSIRAAQRLPAVSAGSRSAVIGISQGGHAALFTAEEAAVYAPELDLAGVVALAPAAELAQAAMLLAFDPTAVGFAVAIGAGLEAAYPEADLATVMTPDAHARLGVVDETCIDGVLAEFRRPADEVLHLEALLEPPWPALLAANTPGQRAAAVPLFIGQGGADALVVPELTDALVARLEALGDEVTYRRYEGTGHGGVVDAAWRDVRGWLEERLTDANDR